MFYLNDFFKRILKNLINELFNCMIFCLFFNCLINLRFEEKILMCLFRLLIEVFC